VLPVMTLALLSGASAVATTDVHRLSSGLRNDLFGSTDPRWVDASASGGVTYLFDGSPYWNAPWMESFWNGRINRVAVLPGPEPGPLPPHVTVSPRFDGRLFAANGAAIDSGYVLASQRMTFVGSPVRSITQPVDGTMLTLWRVDPPLRLRMLRTGIQANGDFSGHAEVDVFGCSPGRLEVTVLGKDGSPVTLGAPGVTPQTVSPAAGIGSHVVIPSPAASGGPSRCRFTLDTPGLAGTTVIDYAPSSS
jgi:hypothetical protein